MDTHPYSAGVDLYNCGKLKTQQLVDFMAASPAHTAMLTTSLRHLLRVQLELGLFDPPADNPYSKLGRKDIDTPAARALAHEAAVQSLVLLRNTDDCLPILGCVYN